MIPDGTLLDFEAVALPDFEFISPLERSDESEALLDSSAIGVGDAKGPRRPGFGRNKAPFQVTGIWVPQQAVEDQPYSLGWQSITASAGMPVWKSGPTMLFLNTEMRQTWFSMAADPGAGPLLLPRTQTEVPEAVTSVGLGTRLMTTFENGWTGSVSLNVGSASDRPFHSNREWNFGTVGMLVIPRGENAWMLSLFYSPTSQLWFPMPGVAYSWNPNEDLSVSLGLPFAVNWQLSPIWRFEAYYVPVTNVSSRFVAKLGERCEVFVGYLAQNESYLLADRVDYRDRFMIFEQRLAGGLQFPLATHWALEVQGGYSFGRYLYEGPNSIAPSADRLDLDPGPFLTLQLLVTF